MSEKTLNDYRAELDTADAALCAAFIKRMELSGEIGRYKLAHNLPVYDPAREEAKLAAIANAADGEFSQYLQRLYKTLAALSREYQQELMSAEDEE